MKVININAKRTKQVSKEICLGNGYRKQFDSVRDAKYFIAETNRFLTECLVILNMTYSEAFLQYRAVWFVTSNNKSGTRTNYLSTQQKIKTLLQTSDEMMDKFNHSHFGSNDPYFAFIDIKKASLFLSEALDEIETFNRKRNLTAAMYASMVLRKRCLLVSEKVNMYPTR